MKKYLQVMKTTFNDSIQYASSLLFRFVGFAIMMAVLISLWNFIYSDPGSTISGYTLSQMIWYLLLAEVITFGSGSSVATDDIRNCIKSGNIAYQVVKPYNYIVYTIFKYIADTLIRFVMFLIVAVVLGLIFAGPIQGFNLITFIAAAPVYFLAVLLTGSIRILISISSFWVEDSKPFQNVFNKFVLIFGVFFPLEMFPKVIQTIIKLSPIYGVSYGPAKLVIDFNLSIFSSTLISQLISLLIVYILIAIVYRRGVKKLNVNGG
jgi:ABC-2 type transport system permease protein